MKSIKISGMHCKKCVTRVENALAEIGCTVTVELDKGIATVDGNATVAQMKDAIEDLGFDVESIT